jgi:hypothetical protein
MITLYIFNQAIAQAFVTLWLEAVLGIRPHMAPPPTPK